MREKKDYVIRLLRSGSDSHAKVESLVLAGNIREGFRG